MKPIISIIIPMYNAASYIEECIMSLQNQTFSNFEIIIVDDGSTDNSFNVCKKKALNDTRIRLFHQDNRGVSNARAYGVKESRGEYIFFIDADDTVKSTILEILYLKITEGYDIVVSACPFEGEYKGSNLVNFILEQKIPVSIWGKLIKRCFLTEQTMFIPPYLNVGEDLALNLKIGLIIDKVYLLSQNLYNYRYNPSSVTANRKVSLNYETTFLKYITNILNNQIGDYSKSYRYLQISSLENLILSRAKIDYNCKWIQDLLKDISHIKLKKKQWIILHIRNPFICRYLLLIGPKICSIFRSKKHV